jgi:hypothetical protein
MMTYDYKTERPKIFTESGVAMLTEMTMIANRCIAQSGAVMMNKMMTAGDSFMMLAVADYLVETKVLHEVTGPNVRGQDRVFVKA